MPFLTQGKTNWKFLLIVVILAIIVAAVVWFCPEGAEEPAPQEEIDTELTLEELRNTEYFAVEYDEKVQLKDGSYFKPWQPDSASGLSVAIYDNKIAFGDLDNDGKEDAAVILSTSGGGSGSFRSLVIMLNRNGKPWYLTEKSLGDRVVVNAITIESGIITLDMIVHAPGDGLCCPSLEKISNFRLFNNQLLEDGTVQEQACIDSGGTVETAMCCLATSDFPDSCLIGACGCSLENSHQVKTCDCGEGRCFDGSECKDFDAENETSECQYDEMTFYYRDGCGWCGKVKSDGSIEKLEDLGIKITQIDTSVGPVDHQLSGVPTFVIDNEIYVGYRTFEQLKELLGC
jgi:hypothetical protein